MTAGGRSRRWRPRWLTRWGLLRLVVLLVLLSFTGCAMMSMPGKSYQGPLPDLGDDQRALAAELKRDVVHLAETIGERNVDRYAGLQAADAYIVNAFSNAGYAVTAQGYEVRGKTCRNLAVERLGDERPDEIIVVGGHYDSVVDCPGANDNATGAAAVLALARRFADRATARTIRFVAFVNEEPPYFLSDAMGSVVYAKGCRDREENVVGMMSLETMGYYRDDEGSQSYPFPFSLFYPDTGNFIGFIGNTRSLVWTRQVCGAFRRHARFPSEGAAVPGRIPGVGWSDHWSFWQQGYAALMVTDTAPFRYPYYHTVQDTPDKVDFDRLARVVAGVDGALMELAGSSD